MQYTYSSQICYSIILPGNYLLIVSNDINELVLVIHSSMCLEYLVLYLYFTIPINTLATNYAYMAVYVITKSKKDKQKRWHDIYSVSFISFSTDYLVINLSLFV